MFLSVRVERTGDLPDGQVASIEFQPDGAVIFYMNRAHISETGAEALQTLMVAARDAYHQAWHLPTVACSGATN